MDQANVTRAFKNAVKTGLGHFVEDGYFIVLEVTGQKLKIRLGSRGGYPPEYELKDLLDALPLKSEAIIQDKFFDGGSFWLKAWMILVKPVEEITKCQIK